MSNALISPFSESKMETEFNVKLLEWLEERVETMREKFFYPFKGKEYFEMRTNSEVMVNILDTI